MDDDPLLAVLHLLDVRVGPDLEPSAAGLVRRPDAADAVDRAPCGEVWPLDELHELLQGGIRVVDGVDDGVADLPEVVRGHLGGHSDGDSVRSVDQQVGELRRQDRRLLEGPVVVVHHVDGVLVQVRQQVAGHLRETRLGVTHGRGRVPVHGSEVTLPVHQGVPEREGLGHPDHGVVRRGVAVRMVLTEDLSDHGGGLLVGPVVH